MRRPLSVFATLFIVACSTTASAQTTQEGLTLRQTFTELLGPVGGTVLGEALSVATALEVATAPTGTSSGGFVFELDESTGLVARTATTFGPSFAERALTSGEGKVSVAVNFSQVNYKKLGDLSINDLSLATVSAGSRSLTGRADLAISSKTLTFAGAVGVTPNFDIGVAIPMISVKLEGISWIEDNVLKDPEDPTKQFVYVLVNGAGTSSGVGDITGFAKYRLVRFGGGQPDPGGISLFAQMRLPTGDKDNLRGLGITRTMAALVVSSGRGRIRPHANAGYEWWSEGTKVQTPGRPATTARDQIMYAAGLEFEAAPKLTLIADLLGRHIRGGGKIGSESVTNPGTPTVTVDIPVALNEGIRKLTFVPGLKLNIKGSLLLSLNVLTALTDDSLHARIAPVVGLDLTF
jgi:hypothetical protein